MTQSTSPLLAAHSLSVARGDALLIEDLSFAVRPGEALHVQGENGAGKSTLMLALAGLIPLAAGNVVLDRDGLAFLGHDNGLLPDLSVSENLDLYAGCGVAPDVKIAQAMGLSELNRKPARTLSFGQARRVALALTCLPDKSVWMLDEPFAGVDPIAIGEIRSLVAKLTGRGLGVLITDHNVRETLGIIDRAVIIHDGQVLMEGTAEKIVDHPEVRKYYLGSEFAL